MVWPVRVRQASKVSSNKGADPAINRRMPAAAFRSKAGSLSMRVYKVGTPMKMVAWAIRAIARRGSKRSIHSILLPLSSAP